VIWGGEEPTFADAAQAQGVLGAIMSRYNEIIGQVQEDGFEPILWVFDEETIIAAEWAEGFACAIGLRPDAWDPLFESKRHAHLLLPILGLCTNEDGSSALGLDAEAEDRLATEAPDMIAGCVGEIARFWRSRGNAHSRKGPGDRDSLPARAATKTGRNDPCPCGSGKKFKKCCGQTD
jgi:yecA family protein